MSLLNDALRKKKREGAPAKRRKFFSKSKSKSKGSKKRFWVAVSATLTVIMMVCGGSLYWSYSNTTLAAPPSRPAASDNQRFAIGDSAPAVEESEAKASPLASNLPTVPSLPSVDPSEQAASAQTDQSDDTTDKLIAAKTPRDDPRNTTTQQTPVEPEVKETVEPKTAVSGPAEKSSAPVEATAPSLPVKQAALPDLKASLASSAAETAASAQLIEAPVELTPEEAEQQRQQRLYLSARRLHRQGRFVQAVGMYRQFLAADPAHFEARVNLGAAYIQLKQFGHALPIVAALHKQAPDNTQVLLQLAVVHIGIGDPVFALTLLAQLEGYADAPIFDIALYKGIAHRHLNQIDSAIDCYGQAEALNADEPRLMFNLAVAYDSRQDYPRAIKYYQKYLAHNTVEKEDRAEIVKQRVQTLRAHRSGQMIRR